MEANNRTGQTPQEAKQDLQLLEQMRVPFRSFAGKYQSIIRRQFNLKDKTITGRILQCQKCGSTFKENYMMTKKGLLHCLTCGHDRFTAIARYTKKLDSKDQTIKRIK